MQPLVSSGTLAFGLGVLTLAVGVLALRSSMEVVMAYEKRALVVRGEFRRMLEPGLNFVPPFVSRTHGIDRRPMELSPDVEGVATRDGTVVDVGLRVEYRVDDPEAAFHGFERDPHDVVDERVTEAVRDTVGRHDVVDLREDPAPVSDAVERTFRDLRRDGVELQEVAVDGVGKAGGSTEGSHLT